MTDRDPFAPLSDAERATTARAKKPKSEWRPIAPVPRDAPDYPNRHPNLGRHSQVWTYRDADGQVLGYVARFEIKKNGKPAKTHRPLVYAEGPFHIRRWRWQGFPKPWPLYGLDRLAKMPGAPVLIVEGEKTADAAALLFPDYAVVSPMHGAQSPANGDFRPLAGRARVIVWPDADGPSRVTFAPEVARLAREAGAASVAAVSVPSNAPESWDLADPLPEGWESGSLRSLLDDAEEMPAEPSAVDGEPERDVVRFPFRLRPRGLEACEKDAEGNREWVSVCSPLEVLALTRSDAGEEWGRLLRVTDPDGVAHEWAMPMNLLAGDGSEYRAHLLSRGLRLAPGKRTRERLHYYLSETHPTARARCVARIGWHGGAFVLPDTTLGSVSNERVLLQTSAPLDHAFRVAGTLGDWQQSVGEPCAGNSRLVLAVSAAFAAPLLAVVGGESGGFHFVGCSSIGKTTALEVGGSAWGGRDGPCGYRQQWRATSNGLEAIAATHCDALLCLDELAQVDARAAGEVAYMLANGTGKKRAARDGSGRPVAAWRALFLSSGELGLADKVREDGGRRATAGQAVRVVDVPADAGAGLGLFDTLHEFTSAAEFAQHLRRAALRFYGTPARGFVERLAAEREAVVDSVRGAVTDFVAEQCPTDADGQVRRVAERFALVAAAGELATAWGVVPWDAGEASRGAATCLRAWLDARGGSGPAEMAAALAQVRAFFASHGSSRFEPLNPETKRDGSERVQRTPNRAGWWRDDSDGRREYWVLPNVYREEMARSAQPKALAAELIARGWLLPDAAGKASQSKNVPGHRTRVYVFTAAALGDDEGGSDAA